MKMKMKSTNKKFVAISQKLKNEKLRQLAFGNDIKLVFSTVSEGLTVFGDLAHSLIDDSEKNFKTFKKTLLDNII